ncbi:MAG: alkaline phosphatase D [Flammeovirgaceae bacterium]|jgi:alkaline phosphatase D
MREVALWVQTKEVAEVYFEYWEVGNTSNKFRTSKIQTKKETAFVANLKADDVLPSKKYNYSLFINGTEVKRDYELSFQTQVLWRSRKDPPNFKFTTGSCVYIAEQRFEPPTKPYGGDYEIFETMHKKSPDFMLWLGDNFYLREMDWDSESGFMKRYTHTRSNPEMQALLGSTHNYAIWDDHDFGSNNSDRSFWNKELSKKAFKLFWSNPNYVNEGITGTFHWADTQFFLLDNRYFRTPNKRVTGDRSILGAEQEQWLIDALKYSKATFKFVALGGQFISTYAKYENHATYAYASERERIISKIRSEKIEGVIFLSGDRHHTELSKLQENPKIYPIYDFTVSPLTAKTYPRTEKEPNLNHVDNTLVNQRNFGEFSVSGPLTDRKLEVKIFGTKGELLWKREIRANDLRYGK